MKPREQFFYEYAGYAYAPGVETPEQGRERGAIQLAAAEAWASEQGVSFEWEIDPTIDSSEFDDSPRPWALWQCLARNENGEIVGAIGGVDFGRYHDPLDDPYSHVVEAEMALDQVMESELWTAA